MADFEARLARLKDRRQGTSQMALESLSFDMRRIFELAGVAEDTRQKEFFETIAEKKSVQYVIGAMEAVSKKSTDISIEEGERVAENLISKLKDHNIDCDKKMQGSVALDVHIKGYSDVDMLIIIKKTLIVEQPALRIGSYMDCDDSRSMEDILKELRLKSEKILCASYPAANVKKDGNKSIALEGGSLKRKVDIVPSCWFDSIIYQINKNENEHERGVKIYLKDKHELDKNFPFKHIKRVNEKDNRYSGNLKCVVRFLKNIIADIDDDKTQEIAKKLSSYDLTAIAYHMNNELEINIPYFAQHLDTAYARLKLVSKTKNFLEFLLENPTVRNSLNVPDDTRKIFDKHEKLDALKILSYEISVIEFDITDFLMKHFGSVN